MPLRVSRSKERQRRLVHRSSARKMVFVGEEGRAGGDETLGRERRKARAAGPSWTCPPRRRRGPTAAATRRSRSRVDRNGLRERRRGGRARDRAPRARRHSVAGRRVGRHRPLSGSGSLVKETARAFLPHDVDPSTDLDRGVGRRVLPPLVRPAKADAKSPQPAAASSHAGACVRRVFCSMERPERWSAQKRPKLHAVAPTDRIPHGVTVNIRASHENPKRCSARPRVLRVRARSCL